MNDQASVLPTVYAIAVFNLVFRNHPNKIDVSF